MLYHWLFMGLIDLIILTYQDIRFKRVVDDRLNYIMLGATFMLMFSAALAWYWIFGLLIASIIFVLVLKKFGEFGEADHKTLFWCFLGFGALDYLLVYLVVLLSITLLFMGLRWIFKMKTATPYYPVLLLSFIVTSIPLNLQ